MLEASRVLLPEPPGGRLRADLLAAAGDLRHLQGFLNMLGDEQHDPETDPDGAAQPAAADGAEPAAVGAGGRGAGAAAVTPGGGGFDALAELVGLGVER